MIRQYWRYAAPTTRLKPLSEAMIDRQPLAPRPGMRRMHDLLQGKDYDYLCTYDASRGLLTDYALKPVHWKVGEFKFE
jgi:hypothetical protein